MESSSPASSPSPAAIGGNMDEAIRLIRADLRAIHLRALAAHDDIRLTALRSSGRESSIAGHQQQPYIQSAAVMDSSVSGHAEDINDRRHRVEGAATGEGSVKIGRYAESSSSSSSTLWQDGGSVPSSSPARTNDGSAATTAGAATSPFRPSASCSDPFTKALASEPKWLPQLAKGEWNSSKGYATTTAASHSSIYWRKGSSSSPAADISNRKTRQLTDRDSTATGALQRQLVELEIQISNATAGAEASRQRVQTALAQARTDAEEHGQEKVRLEATIERLAALRAAVNAHSVSSVV